MKFLYLLQLEKSYNCRKGQRCFDFSYAVHTNVGKRTQKATINGNEADLATALKSGQTVEIITSRLV